MDKIAPSDLKDLASIAIKTPNKRAAVWQEFDLTLPNNLLMDRKWRPTSTDITDPKRDNSCFALLAGISHDASTTAKSYGEVWVTYNVQFTGPKSSA
jgi:hypothetical protein